MIDVGSYPLTIGWEGAFPNWLEPVLGEGRRDAVYVDTGFLHALLVTDDDYHALASLHWRSTRALAYTSPLVVAEVTRQVAKAKGMRQDWRWDRVREVKRLVMDDGAIAICAPPRDVLHRAMVELEAAQMSIPKLDYCDSLSFVLLETLKHRRVLGFDSDFLAIGAALEPSTS